MSEKLVRFSPAKAMEKTMDPASATSVMAMTAVLSTLPSPPGLRKGSTSSTRQAPTSRISSGRTVMRSGVSI